MLAHGAQESQEMSEKPKRSKRRVKEEGHKRRVLAAWNKGYNEDGDWEPLRKTATPKPAAKRGRKRPRADASADNPL